jgi:hypothetical protein
MLIDDPFTAVILRFCAALECGPFLAVILR